VREAGAAQADNAAASRAGSRDKPFRRRWLEMDEARTVALAYTLGVRLRRTRLRSGMTQSGVAAISGISQPTISRMELGRGSGVPLASWVAVASVLGIDLLGPPDTGHGFGRPAILAVAQDGGWTPVATRGSTTIIDRPPRRVPGVDRPRVVAGERACVLVVDCVTDVDEIVTFAESLLRATQRGAPDGWRVASLVVVRRTAANRRRLTESRTTVEAAYPDSGSAWIGALRSTTSTMPTRPGLVWIDAHGTRLIPTGLRLRR